MPCPIGAGVVTRLWQTEEGSCDMRAARLDQILHEFRDGLERIYGCRLSPGVLFGSQARDEAEPDSDIDVMLVLRGAVDPHKEVQRLSSFTSGLSLPHDVVVSCVYLPEDDFHNQQSPLMLNVRREGVLVRRAGGTASKSPPQYPVGQTVARRWRLRHGCFARLLCHVLHRGGSAAIQGIGVLKAFGGDRGLWPGVRQSRGAASGVPCPPESRLRSEKHLGLPACFSRHGRRDDSTYLSGRGVTRGGRRAFEGLGRCAVNSPTSAAPSPTSSPSADTKATSPSACTTTERPARSSSPWPTGSRMSP